MAVPDPSLQVYDSARAVGVYDAAPRLMDVEERILRREVPPGARVLDLGCGSGRTTIPLARMGYRVTGLDLAPAMIAAARSRAPDLDFRVMDAAALAFPDGAFDAAFFWLNGLDCVAPRARRALVCEEVHRVLRPGGVFIFSSHNLVGLATTLRLSRLRTLLVNPPWRWLAGYLVAREPEGTLRLYHGLPPLEARRLARLFAGVRVETRDGHPGAWRAMLTDAGPFYLCRR